MSKFAVPTLLVVFLWGCLAISAVCPAQERTWSDVTDTYRIVAELVSYDETSVTLKQPNGEVITVELDKLSLKDNQFVETLRRRSAMPATPESNPANQTNIPVNVPPMTRPGRAPLPRLSKSNPRILTLDSSHTTGLDLPPRPSAALTSQQPTIRSSETTIRNPRMAISAPNDSINQQRNNYNEEDLVRLRRQLVQLKKQWPANPDPALIQELVNLCSSNDKFLRLSALQLLGRHDGPNQFDVVIQRLNDPSFEIRWIAYEILEMLHDDRAIDPLMQRFETEDVNKIASILQTYGAKIEPKLLPFLDNESRDTRLAACNLLGKIGTGESLEKLEKVQSEDSELMVRMQAKGALRKITERMKQR